MLYFIHVYTHTHTQCRERNPRIGRYSISTDPPSWFFSLLFGGAAILFTRGGHRACTADDRIGGGGNLSTPLPTQRHHIHLASDTKQIYRYEFTTSPRPPALHSSTVGSAVSCCAKKEETNSNERIGTVDLSFSLLPLERDLAQKRRSFLFRNHLFLRSFPIRSREKASKNGEESCSIRSFHFRREIYPSSSCALFLSKRVMRVNSNSD